MDEPLPGREYYQELQRVQKTLVWSLARVQGLDLEDKPPELVGELSLAELEHILDDAVELTNLALRHTQVALAVEGVAVEDEDE